MCLFCLFQLKHKAYVQSTSGNVLHKSMIFRDNLRCCASLTSCSVLCSSRQVWITIHVYETAFSSASSKRSLERDRSGYKTAPVEGFTNQWHFTKWRPNTFLTGIVRNAPLMPNHKFTHQKMCGKPSSQMSSLQSWFPTAMLPRNWIPHRSAAKGESHALIYLPVTLHRAETLETHHHKCHLNLLTKS